jgi:CheY-like chemotaxis protein
LKILYIEDGESFQRTMRRLTTHMGHDLLSALNSKNGYEMAKLPIDLILLDINLPDGNGLDLARKLRAENINTPIIVVSADVMTYSRNDVIHAGCNEFIGKPFDIEQMQQAIEHYLSHPQGRSSQ